jgi:hypothetical protein
LFSFKKDLSVSLRYIVSENYLDRESAYPWLIRREDESINEARACKAVSMSDVKFVASKEEVGFGCAVVASCGKAVGKFFEDQKDLERIRFSGNAFYRKGGGDEIESASLMELLPSGAMFASFEPAEPEHSNKVLIEVEASREVFDIIRHLRASGEDACGEIAAKLAFAEAAYSFDKFTLEQKAKSCDSADCEDGCPGSVCLTSPERLSQIRMRLDEQKESIAEMRKATEMLRTIERQILSQLGIPTYKPKLKAAAV